MSIIKNIKAREILDSRGNPTVEVDLTTKNSIQRASVPSGASTGTHEAYELRDGTERYLGQGVKKAVRNIEKKIFPLIKNVGSTKQKKIDNLMIKKDNTENKKKLGSNSILAVSLAVCKAGAYDKDLQLFEYINKLLKTNKEIQLPRPFFNIINGGKHAGNELAFQEFMISPKASSFSEALMIGSEIYHELKTIIKQNYGSDSINVGDEGGFAPPIKDAEEALDLIMEAIKKARYKNKVKIAIDVAASEFYDKKKKHYVLHKKMDKEELIEYYLMLVNKYPIISIEDPFHEEDFVSFAKLKNKLIKNKILIVGDDLTTTNVERIQVAIRENSCNCLLLKPNQIGTITETLDAVKLAYKNNWKVMVSHRSGETEDTFIADLAVGIGCGMIKSGAPCRGERIAKYNRLLRIEEFLKSKK